MSDEPKKLTGKSICRMFRVPVHLVLTNDDSSQGYFQRLPAYIKKKGRGRR